MATSRARTAAKRQAASVDLDDAEFIRGLRAAVQRIELRCAADLSRFGIKVQNEARRLAPVDTGRLRASIIAKDGTDSRGPYVLIGTNVAYAPFVEYGTSKSAAQPYLRPALLMAMRSLRGG
jgi:HK97 gp10 family phage protein